ncbi:MAG: mannonate dehydratase [Chloroflexi bacterium]|nr:mannonate dehydratase [Chloroflexota bacterium]MCL5275759.1 mannonate dehydratase [Chloroflexota bacterium]
MEPGIKVAVQASPEPSEDDLKLYQQLGAGWVVLWTNAAKSSAEYYASRRKLYEDHGMRVYGFGNGDVHNQDAIVLNLENRDAKVEQYKQHLRDLGKAGIPYTTYAHMANGIWSTEREETRGGASARGFDLDKAVKGDWAGRHYPGPLSHGRRYTQEEIWENFAKFIREVAPVAEEAGVRIGIHPDDPPVPELAGVPRCIFSNYDGYKKALEYAGSPNVGMCLCVGCWLEGGPLMGKGVLETINDFGGIQKIFKVHLRNVDQPLPHFKETFLDDGYMDMAKVMKALRAINFDGVVIPDHIPMMGNDSRIGLAYSIGYINALLRQANAQT